MKRADELLERIGLGDRADAHPHELSGGEQQRVALAAAIAHRPKLLVADEPTGELDAANARTAYALIRELAREEQLTAIVVSHDPQSASIADRVLHIRDGRVSAESVSERGHAEEIVLARGGWLRLPEELLRVSGIAGRASARVEDGGIVVSPAAERAAAAPETTTAARRRRDRGEVVAELRGVTKSYGRRRVLDGVDAAFRGGCLTAVTGRSGSGKTTLLHLLAGLDAPDEGEVVVLGRAPDEGMRRSDVALVAQDAHLIPFLSARENVELVLELRRADRGAAVEALQCGRPRRARRRAGVAAVDGGAGARRARARDRRASEAAARGRADGAPRRGERAHDRRAVRRARRRDRHRRRLRDARSRADRAGRRAVTARPARRSGLAQRRSALVHLALDAGFTTGSVLYADGGYTAR